MLVHKDFKGIWTPQSLIDKAGPSLALKLSAFHLGVFTFSNPEQNKAVINGFLEIRKLSQSEIFTLLKRKKPQELNMDLSQLRICEWCNSTTVCLHKHHFPIPKRNGGKKTVSICPNCHVEFHHLGNMGVFSLVNPYADEINSYMEGVK